MKFLDSSFPFGEASENRPYTTTRKTHQPRFWPPPPRKNVVEGFEDLGTPDLSACGHLDTCAECTRLMERKLQEHWITKVAELKNDVLEFVGLICFGIFMIILVDLLLTYKA